MTYTGLEVPAPRQDPLHAIMREAGYLKVSHAVDETTLNAVRDELTAMVAAFGEGKRTSADYWRCPLPGRDVPVLYRIHNLEVQPDCPAVSALFHSGPLHSLAARCLGEEVESTVCAAIVKLRDVGAEVPWHRDRSDDAVPPCHAANVSLYLDDSFVDNGCLQVVTGSHVLAGDTNMQAWRDTYAETPVPARAGDATVHDVRLVHGSYANRSPRQCIRIVMEFRVRSLSLARLMAGPEAAGNGA